MKTIPKKLFNKVISTTRLYWGSSLRNGEPDKGLLYKRIELATQLQEQTGIDWLAITDFLDSIVKTNGLQPDAENDEIYCALRCLGWEVKDE